jgi:hypothetical protein
MGTNEKPFSPIEWGGQRPGPNGTGHITNDAATGKLTQAQFRSMVRRTQPTGPLPLPVVEGPQVGDRPGSFVQGATAGTGRQYRPSLAGGVLGAVAGVAAYNAYKNRISR